MLSFIDEKINDYCIKKSHLPPAICDELEAYTLKNVTQSQMLVGKLEASFLIFLIKLIRAKNILELGTYTGYSALAMSSALPDDGKLITIDVNKETTALARSFWDRSKSGHKIVEKLGPGLEIIPTLTERFDLVFIDADKSNYLNYLKLALTKLSLGGIVVIDNCLWSGKVANVNNNDEATKAIREVNDYVSESKDLYGTLLPIRDGMLLIQRND
jgi:caffeoyl-CoA O-methyltransferase